MHRIWDQQPGEPAKAFEAFTTYVNTPPAERTGTEVARILQKNHQQMYVLMQKYDWRNRALARDSHLAEQEEKNLVGDRVKMRIRIAKQAMLIQAKVAERWNSLDVNDLDPRYLLRFFQIAANLEMRARTPEGIGPDAAISVVIELTPDDEETIAAQSSSSPETRKESAGIPSKRPRLAAWER